MLYNINLKIAVSIFANIEKYAYLCNIEIRDKPFKSGGNAINSATKI